MNELDVIVNDVPGEASLMVRVTPQAGTTRWGGIRDGRLLIRLAAAPVDGAANDALRSFLSQSLGCRCGTSHSPQVDITEATASC